MRSSDDGGDRDGAGAHGGVAGPDGRDTRWAEHRLARRAELVDATKRAVRRHGAGVGMDGIAQEAGTSKTVLYRHFGDKAGLYLAVAASVDRLILRELRRAATGLTDDPRAAAGAAVEAYLALVEADPEVYRFVVAHPLLDLPVSDDPVSGLTTRIADDVGALLTARLADAGRDTSAAITCAHGLVGLVRSAADQWVGSPNPVPRRTLVHQLSLLVWGGLQALLDPPEDP